MLCASIMEECVLVYSYTYSVGMAMFFQGRGIPLRACNPIKVVDAVMSSRVFH